MDELNVNYFAPKWWVYVMIWLPRTTDNSTYFAQSLEIRGIKSRLYLIIQSKFDNPPYRDGITEKSRTSKKFNGTSKFQG